MKKLFIKDLKSGDILVNHSFAVKSFSKRRGKNNNEYYDLVLSDKTGTVKAKIWSDYFSSCELNLLKEGDVILVTGKVDSFNEDLQVIIQKFSIAKEFNPDLFIEKGERDVDHLFNYILNCVNSLEDEDIKKVIKNVFDDKHIVELYKKTPAGQVVHHNYVGGLIEHVYEMLNFAETAKNLYPSIKYSELVFGIIFHDIGKIYELNFKKATISRTKEGYLLGHIVLGVLFLEQKFPKNFDKEKKARLLHLILSHHGSHENGSPVLPLTLEAQLLSYIDDISSQVGIYSSHMRENIPNEEGFTPYNKYLGSVLYSPPK